MTIAVGYYLAVVTYRFGLDPDNQGVPIITSVMDLVGVACILLVMTSSGVPRPWMTSNRTPSRTCSSS